MKKLISFVLSVLMFVSGMGIAEGIIIDSDGNTHELSDSFEIELEEDYPPEYYNTEWIMSRIDAFGKETTADILSCVFLAGIIQYYYEDPEFAEDYWYISDYELILFKMERLMDAFGYSIIESPESICLSFSEDVQLVFRFADDKLDSAEILLAGLNNYDETPLHITVRGWQ